MRSGIGVKLVGLGSWIGPPLALAGALSYFLYFVQFPALRDVPWINLPIVAVAAFLACLGMRGRHKGFARRAAIVSASFSSVVLMLFAAYLFWISYLLPPPTSIARSLDRVPGLTLLSSDGSAVDLSAFHGRKLVIVFYRGFW